MKFSREELEKHMKIFVWENVDPITTSWHSGGSVLVAAPDVEAARTLWKEYVKEEIHHMVMVGIPEEYFVVLDGDPNHIFPSTDEMLPIVLVFPDAGCC